MPIYVLHVYCLIEASTANLVIENLQVSFQYDNYTFNVVYYETLMQI